MKIVNIIITYLVGLIYFVFGLNFFLNFIPIPPMEGDALVFMGVLAKSGYMTVVKLIEIPSAILLLVNYKRPLAWLLLLPITCNILIFEVLLAHKPAIGVVIFILNAYMIYANKAHYKGIFQSQNDSKN